ncbi:MAG: protein kinase domain-containing protein [Acidimicrobiales bacterium]
MEGDSRVGDYEFGVSLGRGSLGTTYRVRWPGQGQDSVAKLIPTAGDAALALRLRHATSVWSRLGSPVIMPVRDVLEGQDVVALVADFYRLGSLAEVTQCGGMLGDVAAVLAMATELSAALTVIHGAGLAHGNIKATNVLWAGEASPVLADGGLAPALSLEALSPEPDHGGRPSHLNRAQADDIRAVAALCCLVLTGRAVPARTGESTAAVLARPLNPNWRGRPSAGQWHEDIERAWTAATQRRGPRELRRATVVEPTPREPHGRFWQVGVKGVALGLSAMALLGMIVAGDHLFRNRTRSTVHVLPPARSALIGPPFGARVQAGPTTATPVPRRACSVPVVVMTPGGERVAGGTGPNGCPEVAIWSGDIATVVLVPGSPPERFALGAPGDVLLLGNWNCAGPAAPALYRPSTGTVYFFANWSGPGGAQAQARGLASGISEGRAQVAHSTDGCDQVEVSGVQRP